MDTFRIASPPFPVRAEVEDIFLPLRGDALLVRATSGGVSLCRGWPKALKQPVPPVRFIGWLRDRPCHALVLEARPGVQGQQGPPGYLWKDIRALHGLLTEPELLAGMTALEVVRWDRMYRLCPTCGAALEEVADEWAKRCAACGVAHAPRKQPTVLVLVHAGPQVLLAQPQGLGEIYSLPAVGIGPGMSLERTLCQHLLQALGVALREADLQLFGSQSWPFPDRLMIALHASSGQSGPGSSGSPGSKELRWDSAVYQAARWFHVDDLPPMPAPLSLARRLVDWYAGLPRVAGKPSVPKR